MRWLILPFMLVMTGCNTVDSDSLAESFKRAAVDSLAGAGTYAQAMAPTKEELEAEATAMAATPPSKYPISHKRGADGIFDIRIDLPDDAPRDLSSPSTRPLRRQLFLYGNEICGAGQKPFIMMSRKNLPAEGPASFRASCLKA